MSLDTIFTLELLLAVAVLVIIVAGAIYLSLHDRRGQRQTSRRVRTGNVPAATSHDEPTDGAAERVTPRRTPRREFYKSMGLATSEDMKLRLYSSAEYKSELGGESDALKASGFLAALKAYRMLDGEWYDYSPQKAAGVLELSHGDYEVDSQRQALLLRRLPPGMPTSAQDAL